MDTTSPPQETLGSPSAVADTSPLPSTNKGKRKNRRRTGDLEGNLDLGPGEGPPPKRSKWADTEPRARPARERKQSSYASRYGFLDEAAIQDLENHTSQVEKRRAAFYNTQSYSSYHPFS